MEVVTDEIKLEEYSNDNTTDITQNYSVNNTVDINATCTIANGNKEVKFEQSNQIKKEPEHIMREHETQKMKSVFKIWTGDREQKCFIVVDTDSQDKYTELILKASAKFKINGSKLVLETDGTSLEEEVLEYVKTQTLILLQNGEEWQSVKDQCTTSTATTLPISSSATNQLEKQCKELSYEVNNEDITITSTIDCNFEYFWESFEIPLDALSQEQKEVLNKGMPCPKQIKTCLVHLVVNKMRSIKKLIPCKAFKVVAKKIIDKYPMALRDVDEDGIVLGDGSHSLVQKLQERNNYLNRPHKNPADLSLSSNPICNKKRNVSARAGCANWAPSEPSLQLENNTYKETEMNDDNFIDMMETTYPKQRLFLNKNPRPTMGEIKEEWPILLSERGIFWHFSKLTNSDIHLLDQYKDKIEKLCLFCQNTSGNTETTTTTDIYIQLIKELTTRFKEKPEQFYLVSENLLDLDKETLPVTPLICHIQGGEVPHFLVFFQREPVNSEGYPTFVDALKVAFALYFNFNVKYPEKCSVTLELLQRYIFKIHPDSGSKCRQVAATKKKIFALLNKLK